MKHYESNSMHTLTHHQDQQGFSNDIKSVAKGVMIWEISM
jgi:hypothetical protein